MGTGSQPSRQRGAASDPRHGRARGDVIRGSAGASPVQQVLFVGVTIVVVVGAFFLALRSRRGE